MRLWRLEIDPGYWENAISKGDNLLEIAFSLAWGCLKSAGTSARNKLFPALAPAASRAAYRVIGVRRINYD